MRDWTYLELKTKVQQDLDLEDETTIGDAEMLAYCNEAIDEAEAEIHKLGVEDEYFLDYEYLALVTSTSEYALPAQIYANKIRALVYRNGSELYTIHRFRGKDKFVEIEQILQNGTSDFYQYLIVNRSTTGARRLVLLPASRETSSTVAKLWFIRNAKRLTASGDVLDIPEFANFILSYMKVRCLGKDGDARYTDELPVLQAQRKLMIETLTEMVVDDDTEIIADMSHYEEMS